MGRLRKLKKRSREVRATEQMVQVAEYILKDKGITEDIQDIKLNSPGEELAVLVLINAGKLRVK